jgi:type VI protein secretion system component Hcp
MIHYVEFCRPIDDSCEAVSINFGMQTPALGFGSGSAVGRTAQLKDVQFVKRHDSMSDAIMHHCLMGTVFDTVWVEILRNANASTYVAYTLSSVVITGVRSANDLEFIDLNSKTTKVEFFGR